MHPVDVSSNRAAVAVQLIVTFFGDYIYFVLGT